MRTHVLNLTRLGWSLAIPVLLLSTIGLASIHVSEALSSTGAGSDAGRIAPAQRDWIRTVTDAIGPLTLRQGMYLLSGLGLMLIMLGPSYRRVGEYSYWIYWIVIAMLALLLLDKYGRAYGIDVPFVAGSRDDTVWRWIRIGPLGLQPSEFMKVAFVIVLAYYLRFRKSYRTWPGLIPPFLLTLLPMVLILKQPDLGTLLMLLPVLFTLLFVAGARLRHLATIVFLGCATLPVFYLVGMKEYQRERIQVLFKQNTDAEEWHLHQGYQLRQSLIALGTGGATGVGYGEGALVHYRLLPEKHNDFIFAVIGNQWGLVGCIIVICAYVVIIICGLEVAMVTNDPFGRLLAVGVVVMIVAQALLNICMNIGLAPITGMTLPFVSFGGSSIWANFLALGLLVNVAQRRPMMIGHPPFEHADD